MKTKRISDIKRYFTENLVNQANAQVYTKSMEAKTNYIHDIDYYLIDEDRESLVMLASSWSALLRKTWRRFIVELEYEEFMFWNAFIQIFIFGQNILFQDQWQGIIKLDKKLSKMISKTSNPKFIEKVFTGMDWKWLRDNLTEYFKQNA